jgi:hypothetical protein
MCTFNQLSPLWIHECFFKEKQTHELFRINCYRLITSHYFLQVRYAKLKGTYCSLHIIMTQSQWRSGVFSLLKRLSVRPIFVSLASGVDIHAIAVLMWKCNLAEDSLFCSPCKRKSLFSYKMPGYETLTNIFRFRSLNSSNRRAGVIHALI